MGYDYSYKRPSEQDRRNTGGMGYWRETAKPGMVYRALHDNTNHRYFKGDLFICLHISGDCHYTWVRIAKRVNNNYHIYYTLGETVFGYGKDFELAFPDMRPFTDHDLVHIFVNKEALIKSSHTYSKEERAEFQKLKEQAQSSADARLALMQKFGVNQL